MIMLFLYHGGLDGYSAPAMQIRSSNDDRWDPLFIYFFLHPIVRMS